MEYMKKKKEEQNVSAVGVALAQWKSILY